MRIDVFADVVCPWCYIGRTHLYQALDQLGITDATVRIRSFELQPDAPEDPIPTVDYLAQRYGGGRKRSRQMMAGVTERAAAAGLEFHLELTEAGRTLDAHRLLHFAESLGRQAELVDAMYRAYFTDGRSVFDPDELLDIATSAGLPATETKEVLGSDRFTEQVHGDHAQARAYGIKGVPFFVINDKYAISGAQPVDVFVRALSGLTD